MWIATILPCPWDSPQSHPRNTSEGTDHQIPLHVVFVYQFFFPYVLPSPSIQLGEQLFGVLSTQTLVGTSLACRIDCYPRQSTKAPLSEQESVTQQEVSIT